MEAQLNAPINKFKVANLIIGAISLVVGLFSHFQSLWVKPYEDALYLAPLYRICDAETEFREGESCPNIALEQFYVSVIIICFVLSFVTFIIGLGVDLRKEPYKKVDLVYHVISTIALVVGGSLYIISAVQIYALFDLKNAPENSRIYRFRTIEKFAASAIAFLQAFSYAITAFNLKG